MANNMFLARRFTRWLSNQASSHLPGFLCESEVLRHQRMSAMLSKRMEEERSAAQSAVENMARSGIASNVVGVNLSRAMISSQTEAENIVGLCSNQERFNVAKALISSCISASGLGAFGEGDAGGFVLDRSMQSKFMASLTKAILDRSGSLRINSSVPLALLGDGMDDAMECANVLKKRRKKMNKHKHRKRLRKNRYKNDP